MKRISAAISLLPGHFVIRHAYYATIVLSVASFGGAVSGHALRFLVTTCFFSVPRHELQANTACVAAREQLRRMLCAVHGYQAETPLVTGLPVLELTCSFSRNCGKTVCADCSKRKLSLFSLGFATPVRVCDVRVVFGRDSQSSKCRLVTRKSLVALEKRQQLLQPALVLLQLRNKRLSLRASNKARNLLWLRKRLNKRSRCSKRRSNRWCSICRSNSSSLVKCKASIRSSCSR